MSISLNGDGIISGVTTLTTPLTGITTFSSVVTGSGSTSAPSISPSGDSNTGVFFPSADTIALSSGGSERVRVDSSGRLAIGTASVTGKLSIDGSSLNPIPSLNTASNYAIALYGGSATGNGNGIAFCNDNGTSVGGAIIHIDQGSNNLGDLAFYTAATANSPTERARLTSDGKLLIGTSTSRIVEDLQGNGPQGLIQIEAANSDAIMSIISAGTADAGRAGTLSLGRHRNSTVGGTPTVVQSGDTLGAICFAGGDGTDMRTKGASIACQVDGTPGSNDMPGRLVFSTTADSASIPTERMRINQLGVLKASNDGTYANSTGPYHEFVSSYSDEWAFRVWHRGNAAQQYGILVRTTTDQNDTTRAFLYCEGATTQRAVIRSNGGLANYSANNVNLSDINSKKDITPAAGTWDCLKEWEIVNFRYKDQSDDADLNMGVIAQQVAESCPEVITVFQEAKEATEDQPAQEERLGVKDQQMMWMAIKALQEAQLRIEILEAEVAALKGV